MNDSSRRRERTSIMRLGAEGQRTPEPATSCAHLIVVRGQPTQLGRVHSLSASAPTTIGRDHTCNLTLDDPLVSATHARVLPQRAGGFVLIDLQSTNGTRVDGKPVRGSWSLRDGDKLYLGETMLLFSEADEAELSLLREPLGQLGKDRLTDLDSKRRFDEALDAALTSTRMLQTPLALLMLDIDNLGGIGRKHGQAAAADCIRAVGRVIGVVIGSHGHACRYGGDDFSAFLKGIERPGGLEVAELIRASVEGLRLLHGDTVIVPTLSIGVAASPDDGDCVLDLVIAADRALYRAKTAGKNRVETR
jgi:two-component system, cell cycle response regulator